MRKVTTLALAAMALAAAGCARNSDITVPDAGYSGGAGLGGLEEGTGPLGAYGGTLPGSNVSDRVLFAVDQTTLSPEATGILNQQVGWLTQNPTGPILIEGHADERGTGEYNMALGVEPGERGPELHGEPGRPRQPHLDHHLRPRAPHRHLRQRELLVAEPAGCHGCDWRRRGLMR